MELTPHFCSQPVAMTKKRIFFRKKLCIVRQWHNRSLTRVLTMLVHKYVDQKGLVAMLAAKRSAGVTTEVNLRILLCTGDKACKQGIHPGFETHGRRHQKSKNRVISGPTKRTDVFQKFSNKKEILLLSVYHCHVLTFRRSSNERVLTGLLVAGRTGLFTLS